MRFVIFSAPPTIFRWTKFPFFFRVRNSRFICVHTRESAVYRGRRFTRPNRNEFPIKTGRRRFRLLFAYIHIHIYILHDIRFWQTPDLARSKANRRYFPPYNMNEDIWELQFYYVLCLWGHVKPDGENSDHLSLSIISTHNRERLGGFSKCTEI